MPTNAERSSRVVPGHVRPQPKDAGHGPTHAARLSSHRLLRACGMVVVAVLSFGGTAAAAIYVDLDSQITTSNTTQIDGQPDDTVEPTKDPEDPFAGKALNILVMGTDLRDDANAAIAGRSEDDSGMRSDTTLLVHVSGDRTRMEVVSIPRDSLVPIPSCNLPDGTMSQPVRRDMFNSAFEIGSGGSTDENEAITYAAGCTIRTVYNLTGVRITNHVVIKMTGVIGVVDAIGGVRMCFPEPVKENKNYGTLDLPAGEQVLNGLTSIDFLRARHGKGLGLQAGSDLTRIKRQQAFLDSAMREVLSKNVITDSPKLYGVIRASLAALNTDEELNSPARLGGLAYSLKDIKPSEIVFTELPVIDAPSDSNRVVWTKDADAIWARIKADKPPGWTPESETPSPAVSGSAVPGATTAPVPSPGDTLPDTTVPPSPVPSPSPIEDLLPGVCPEE